MSTERTMSTLLVGASTGVPTAIVETGGKRFRFLPIAEPHRVAIDQYRVRP